MCMDSSAGSAELSVSPRLLSNRFDDVADFCTETSGTPPPPADAPQPILLAERARGGGSLCDYSPIKPKPLQYKNL